MNQHQNFHSASHFVHDMAKFLGRVMPSHNYPVPTYQLTVLTESE